MAIVLLRTLRSGSLSIIFAANMKKTMKTNYSGYDKKHSRYNDTQSYHAIMRRPCFNDRCWFCYISLYSDVTSKMSWKKNWYLVIMRKYVILTLKISRHKQKLSSFFCCCGGIRSLLLFSILFNYTISFVKSDSDIIYSNNNNHHNNNKLYLYITIRE